MEDDEEKKTFWGLVRLLIICHTQENDDLKASSAPDKPKKSLANELATNALQAKESESEAAMLLAAQDALKAAEDSET